MTSKMLFLKISNELHTIIKVEEIYFAERWDKNNIRIHYKGGMANARMSLAQFYNAIGDNSFERTHKSFIVNISEISEVHNYFNNYLITFKESDKTALLTPEKLKEIRTRLISF